MQFSERTGWEDQEGGFAARLERARAGREALLDLTRSNPTECGLPTWGDDALAPFRNPEALRYRPDPLGMREARRAVVRYYADHDARVRLHDVCLTTSTSEAYSFLFRLLCDPGDEVLIARPGYPLFDSIARLDGVELRPYPLLFDPGGQTGHSRNDWSLDLHALETGFTERTRAVVLVHPNNPTGNYASAQERAALRALCARTGVALLVDEVFLDYAFERPGEPSFLAESSNALVFVLSGLSKVCALPQMKLSWLVAHGPETEVREAMRRLEIVSDTFLSMNAPVQHAATTWLAERTPVQEAIRERVSRNLAELDGLLRGTHLSRMGGEGGWTAVLRVPVALNGVTFAEAALERGVIVQPGPLYGMGETRAVVSLLTDPEVWSEGLRRLTR